MAFSPVSLKTTARSPTAAVAATTTWEEFPSVWPVLLDEVYGFVRASGATQAGHNVMLYRDDAPNVEVGVQVAPPFEPNGRVVPWVLPAGEIASTTHQGPYDALDEAHAAVKAWCRSHGHALTGVRWETYGDRHDDPAELETEVCYLLA